MHHVIDLNQNISPHEDNGKAVKHCSVAIAKTVSVSSRRTLQKFKPKAPRKKYSIWSNWSSGVV